MATLGRILFNELIDKAEDTLAQAGKDLIENSVFKPIQEMYDSYVAEYNELYGSLPDGFKYPFKDIDEAFAAVGNKAFTTFLEEVKNVKIVRDVKALVNSCFSIYNKALNTYTTAKELAEDKKAAQDVAQTSGCTPPSTGGTTALIFTSTPTGGPVVVTPGTPLPL